MEGLLSYTWLACLLKIRTLQLQHNFLQQTSHFLIHRGRLRKPHHHEMSEPSDPITVFEREPTFRNLLRATPRLFSSGFYSVFELFGFGASCLLWGLFVGVHLLGIIAAFLILRISLSAVSDTLTVVWYRLTGFM